MDRITDKIAIGNYLEAQDAASLKRLGIRAVISLDGTLNEQQAERLEVLEIVSLPLADGPGNDLRDFQFGIAELDRLVKTYESVLVQCHAGRSRSAALIAGHFVAHLGFDPDSAITAIASRREINIAPELVELLYQIEE